MVRSVIIKRAKRHEGGTGEGGTGEAGTGEEEIREGGFQGIYSMFNPKKHLDFAVPPAAALLKRSFNTFADFLPNRNFLLICSIHEQRSCNGQEVHAAPHFCVVTGA